jgi:hypothetical protein
MWPPNKYQTAVSFVQVKMETVFKRKVAFQDEKRVDPRSLP